MFYEAKKCLGNPERFSRTCLPVLPSNDHSYRFNNDAEVKQKGMMLYVIKIKSQHFDFFIDIALVLVSKLSQTDYSR
jgi:hypothetical protein